eukprot:jgi/Mesvir1/19882/Mv13167-RA.1
MHMLTTRSGSQTADRRKSANYYGAQLQRIIDAAMPTTITTFAANGCQRRWDGQLHRRDASPPGSNSACTQCATSRSRFKSEQGRNSKKQMSAGTAKMTGLTAARDQPSLTSASGRPQYIDAHPHHTIVDRTTGNPKPFTTQENVQVVDQSVKKVPDALPWVFLWGVSLAAVYMTITSIQGARGSLPRTEGESSADGQGPTQSARAATSAAMAAATAGIDGRASSSCEEGGASEAGRPANGGAATTASSSDARVNGARAPATDAAKAAAEAKKPLSDPAWEKYMERQMADVRRQQLVMANEKEARRNPDWWLALPHVFVIYIQGIGPDHTASEASTGLYALNMQADLRDAPALHAIAFADRAEAERCVWLLRSHVAAEAQERARAGDGDGRLLSVPSVNVMEPKELKQIVDMAGYKATVIRKGEMRIEPHMSKEAIEQQFMEIGGMEYWRQYLKNELKKQEDA